MLPGPDRIVACPRCKGLAKYMTLTSGNTFGARLWTDGKQEAPMLPRPPDVVKCRHCGECYWLRAALAVGEIDRWGGDNQPVHPAWATAPKVEEPTEDEYYLALDKGLAADAEQEKALRMFAWWRRNDLFRKARHAQPAGIARASEACRRNLDALKALLDEADDNDRIMKAEVLRELGEFESAAELLGRVDSTRYGMPVRQILSLCESRDTCVRELNLDDR